MLKTLAKELLQFLAKFRDSPCLSDRIPENIVREIQWQKRFLDKPLCLAVVQVDC